jgi:3alpha(or 20beta)-hydroxysteroid dehydrogenase
MTELAGRVAIVTGGGNGMGAAHAARLAAAGSQVVVTDIDESAASRVGAYLSGSLALHHDVTDPLSWATVVESAKKAFGRIDVLVNNAGVGGVSGLMETDFDTYQHIVGVNQNGPWLGMRAVIPEMTAGGSIINISSTGGLSGSTRAAAYSATKWALRGLTKCVAAEVASLGIRVNSVHPGRIDTAMLRGFNNFDEDTARSGIPLGRIGAPEDIAELVLFLAGDRSSFCTGAEFVADGGQSAVLYGT